MEQEKPVEVNAALVKWLATRVPDAWPQPKSGQWWEGTRPSSWANDVNSLYGRRQA
jgi:hypothetical protein